MEPALDGAKATPRDAPGPVGEAFSSLPEGVFLMTSRHEDDRAGVLVHAVLQACEQPPMIVVAARKGHAIDPIIRDARCFAIGVVRPDDRLILRRFRFADTAVSPRAESEANDLFDPFPEQRLVTGAPILDRCPIWFDCQIARHVDLESEYELFVGLVVGVRTPSGDMRLPG
ncbi:MAG: flavin reductase family protein [Planctomycetota bacterium]